MSTRGTPPTDPPMEDTLAPKGARARRMAVALGILFFLLVGAFFTGEALAVAVPWIKEDGVRVSVSSGGVPYVTRLADGRYRMYYCGPGGILSAMSNDGLDFTPEAGIRLTSGMPGSGEDIVCDPTLIPLADGGYRMYYKGQKGQTRPPIHRLYSAISSDGLTFTREGLRYQNTDVCKDFVSVPDAVLLADGRVRVYFVCDPQVNATYSIISSDGLNFSLEGRRLDRAVDPSVLRLPDETYLMIYATNPPPGGVVPPTRLYLATSQDGLDWRVEGEILRAGGRVDGLDDKGTVDPSVVHLESGGFRVYYGGLPSSGSFLNILSAVSGPVIISLDIDIKPGSSPNSINPRSKGTIPVAILSTPGFDAPARADKTSLTFGRTGNEESLAFCTEGAEDVNEDGLLDQVCHFDTESSGFEPGDTLGILRGKTLGGIYIGGSDSVRIVGRGHGGGP